MKRTKSQQIVDKWKSLLPPPARANSSNNSKVATTRPDEDHKEEEQEDLLWLIGSFVQGTNDTVEWTFYPHQEALNLSQRYIRTNTAHVLWNCETGIFEFVCSGSNSKSDVAAILKAYQVAAGSSGLNSTTVTTINRHEVDKAVEQGQAPPVPPYANQATQWALIRVMEMIFRRESVSYFAAAPLRMTSIYHFDFPPAESSAQFQPAVALTLDDAPCRFSNNNNSRMPRVLELLEQYNAKATFMIIDSFVRGHENDLIRALQQGHEFANHGVQDESFKNSTPQEFAEAIHQCNETIQDLRKKAAAQANNNNNNAPGTTGNSSTIGIPVKFFRAPHAYYTKEMEDVLLQRGMRNVMCDAYASCPIVQDSNQIAKQLLRQAQPGSILLLHMPEVGFRDWTLSALEMVLQGLQEKNYKVVTLSQLEAMSLSLQSANGG